MKKSLLLSTALLVGVGAFAQSNRQMLNAKLYGKARPTALADVTEAPNAQRTQAPNSIMTSYLFSDARNGFGLLVEETNPLHYNQDLNMVAWTQRLPIAASWPTTGLPTTGTSGFIVTKYSTDNGQNWNGVCYMNNGTAWSRYPSGVIANAPGNTDPAEAKFVGTGPCTASAGGWPFNWFASVPANATGNVTSNDQRADSTAATAVAGTSQGTYFSSYGTIANGTTVWTGAREIDASDNFMGVAVFKGVRGATVNDPYTWTVDHSTFNGWLTNAGGDYYAQAPKFAFSPDGQTGYVLINGVLASSTGDASKSLQPNVWKTTDAGATWTLVNANYSWRANHPEMLCNLIPTLHDSDWMGNMAPNETYPAFFDAHGAGMTVDNNGVLHYVTTVVPAYSSHVDSMFYIYGQYGFGYTQNDDLDKPWIYDLTTTGNGVWNQKIIGKLYTRNIETDDLVPDPAAWTTDGTAPMDYTNRIRVSRSQDGTKIFYTWTDGDTSNVVSGAYHANTNPNLEYRGYDVASDMFSMQKEMSALDAAEGGYYNYYSSTISMPSASGYTIPAVYMSSQDGNLNATNAVDFNYIYDMEIMNSEYNQTIASNTNIIGDQNLCVSYIGLKQVAGNEIRGVSQNYPNPFNGSSFVKVSLNKSENITLSVMNNIGQVMTTTTVKGNAGENFVTIDASNLTSGIYFYTVTAGASKVTRKMSVVK